MTRLEIACLWLGAALVFAAAWWRLRKAIGTMAFRTQRQRISGFSVFDLHVSMSGSATRRKREAALYVTLKSCPPERLSPAKLLFDDKVRRLGE